MIKNELNCKIETYIYIYILQTLMVTKRETWREVKNQELEVDIHLMPYIR